MCDTWLHAFLVEIRITLRHFTKYLLLPQEKKRLLGRVGRNWGGNSIILMGSFEVYEKIQFVEHAGGWKTPALTEWILWTHFTYYQTSESVWSTKCMFETSAIHSIQNIFKISSLVLFIDNTTQVVFLCLIYPQNAFCHYPILSLND